MVFVLTVFTDAMRPQRRCRPPGPVRKHTLALVSIHLLGLMLVLRCVARVLGGILR